MRSLILSSAVVLLFTCPAVANATWPILRCTDANGNQVFTDSRPAFSLYCEPYSPQSPPNTIDKVPDNSYPTAKDAEARYTVEPRVSNPVITGSMDFSALARLSVGMTEAAVLVVAGAPKIKLPGTWIYSMDDLTVELRFGGGPPSLAEIRQYQTKAR